MIAHSDIFPRHLVEQAGKEYLVHSLSFSPPLRESKDGGVAYHFAGKREDDSAAARSGITMNRAPASG